MMNAWLQRAIVLGTLIFWWTLGASLWSGQQAWAMLCFCAPFLILPLLLAMECLWAAWINRQETVVRPASMRQWLSAWFSEYFASTKVFTYWQPFHRLAVADGLNPTPDQRGIVLVHGFFCNRALWMDWMHKLHAQRRVFVAVDLEPAFGSISAYADSLEAAIQKVEQLTGLPPVLVGHSMGGLAIRAWAAKYLGKKGDMRRIHRIFTLGTPHQGTALAAASHTLNGRQMRMDSPWLAENAAGLPRDFAKHCTCYFSHCDNIVFPASAATLPDADNQHITAFAHVQLVFSKEIQRNCLASLN